MGIVEIHTWSPDQASARIVRMPRLRPQCQEGDRADRSDLHDHVAKAGRERKILIDFMRNHRTNTSARRLLALRARPGALVSMPLEWRELSGGPERWTLLTAPKRLKRLKADPWAGYWSATQRLSNAATSALRQL